MKNNVKVVFSKESVLEAIGLDSSASEFKINLNNAEAFKVSDYHVTCVSVEYTGGKICVDLPFVGEICFDVPVDLPIGAQLEVCLDVTTTFGVPTGFIITVKFNGNIIYTFKIGL